MSSTAHQTHEASGPLPAQPYPSALADALINVDNIVGDALDVVAENPTLRTFTAGGIAGCMSRTVTAPVDRVKVMVQDGSVLRKLATTAAPPTTDFQRARAVGRHVYTTEGLAAFWRGNGVNCMKAGPEQAITFTAREFYMPLLCRDAKAPTGVEQVMLGAASGGTAQLILYPLELAKTRMAVAPKGQYASVADCFGQAVRAGGFRSLYSGMGANMAGIVPHRGLEFGAFFTLSQTVQDLVYGGAALPIHATMACGLVASVGAQSITYPLNLVRTRLQTQGAAGSAKLYSGAVHCFTHVLRHEGVAGLFAGILPNMMKAVPSSMISFCVFKSVSAELNARKETAGNKRRSRRSVSPSRAARAAQRGL